MTEYITLVGAEDVARAARQIQEFLKQPCSEPATFSAWQSSAPDPYDHTLACDVHIEYMLDIWDQPFPFDQEGYQREHGGETALCCWLGESTA